MTEIFVSLINTCGLVAVAFIGQGLLRRVRRVEANTKATREQVENNHDTNLREESDERHTENSDKLDSLISKVTGVERDIGGIRSELRGLRTDDADQRERLHELEKTNPKWKDTL